MSSLLTILFSAACDRYGLFCSGSVFYRDSPGGHGPTASSVPLPCLHKTRRNNHLRGKINERRGYVSTGEMNHMIAFSSPKNQLQIAQAEMVFPSANYGF